MEARGFAAIARTLILSSACNDSEANFLEYTVPSHYGLSSRISFW